MNRIVLTGYMGTGKSTVGKALAKQLAFNFIDIDDVVSTASGLTVSEIFDKHGESYFRGLETEALVDVCCGDRLVIATGGGAVISKQNRELIKKESLVVNLTATAEEIYIRLSHEDERPLLRGSKNVERIQCMLLEREPFYADADVRIDTAGKSIEEITEAIIKLFMARQNV